MNVAHHDDNDDEHGLTRLRAGLAHYAESLALNELPINGRLDRLTGLTLVADGCEAALGDRCAIEVPDSSPVEAEVVGFNGRRTLLMPTGPLLGLRSNARVTRISTSFKAPVGKALLGRVIDANAEPWDGLGPLRCPRHGTLSGKTINPLSRRSIDEPFDVGVRAINGLVTLGRGQRVGLLAGSGVGKSSLLGMMTQHSSADVTVIALIGERGREVQEFVAHTLGDEGMRNAIVVAVPADQPPLSRLQGALLATTIAENFCREGKEVLLLVDSLTRFAQAQREIGLATGEPPTTKGYPPSVFASLPRLVERAGRFDSGGSITGIYTVLAEGDDQNDPIVDAVRAVLDGHIVLSRSLSEAAHFPAIDIGASVSRIRRSITSSEHDLLIQECLKLAASYRAQEDMLRVGLYQEGSDPTLDRALAIWPQLTAYLQQSASEGVSLSESTDQLRQLLTEAPD